VQGVQEYEQDCRKAWPLLKMLAQSKTSIERGTFQSGEQSLLRPAGPKTKELSKIVTYEVLLADDAEKTLLEICRYVASTIPWRRRSASG